MQRPHTRVVMGAFAALQIMIGTVIQFQYQKLSRSTNPCDEKLLVWHAHQKLLELKVRYKFQEIWIGNRSCCAG